MTELTLGDIVQRSPTAATASVDGQLVALDVAEGVCYGLNRVATRIWELLETPKMTSDICLVLCAEYAVDPQTCADETLDLLRDLHTAKLVTVASSAA